MTARRLSTPSIGEARQRFEAAVAVRAAPLPHDAADALLGMLTDLRAFAAAAAAESLRRSKPVMYAYWKVVATYAGHLARVIRQARRGG